MRTSRAAVAARAPYEQASASTLVAQPLHLPAQELPLKDDWPEIYQHVEGRIQSLRTWRYSWWQTWAILAQYMLPYRYHWVISANTFNRGFPVNDVIINERATKAMLTCSSGCATGLMSASRPWFKMDVALERWPVDAQGQDWLDDTTERLLAILASSNFYAEGNQMWQDLVTFGTSVMLLYEDKEDIVRAYIPCAGEYFLASSGRLANDVLYREFTYTVQQIVDFWGIKRCPPEVRTMWQQGSGALDREFVVAHAIEPNFKIASRRGGPDIQVVPDVFPYREVYWLRGREANQELSRRGFMELPFISPRWSKTSNDPYGRGPGHWALGGTRQLQRQESRGQEFIEKVVRPPMVGDVTLENKPSSILPGEITFVNAQDGKPQFYPAYELNPAGIGPMTVSLDRLEKRINEMFYVDLFMMISQMEGVQPRNQLEILERKGEKIQQLGPMIELFEQEASRAINRVLAIAVRRRVITPPPPSLRGAPIGITYTSQMKMLQRAAETAAMERGAAWFGSITEAALAAGLPPPNRIVNWDEAGREYAKLIGWKRKLLYTERQVQEQDQAKQQQAAENQLAQATLPAVQAAQALSKTEVGGGQNALESMLGPGTR